MTQEESEQDRPWCRDHRGRKYSYEEFVRRVEEFHGYAAPGLVLGGAMVGAALERMPPGVLFDAVCETWSCLPDAVQLLTPCTMGNGWLRIRDTGRFAVTLFDKESGDGVRVSVRADRLEEWPETKTFFFKLVPKKFQDLERLFAEIRRCGEGVCGVERVTVRPEVRRKAHLGPVAVCPGCGEGYPVRDGDRCRACAGQTYYDR